MRNLMLMLFTGAILMAAGMFLQARETSQQRANLYISKNYEYARGSFEESSRLTELKAREEGQWRTFVVSLGLAAFFAIIARQAHQIDELNEKIKKLAHTPAAAIHKIFCANCREATPANAAYCLHCGQPCHKPTADQAKSSGLKVFGGD